MPLVRFGMTLHPPGEYDSCLVMIDYRPEEEGPFGPWAQAVYRTPHGQVAQLMSFDYTPESDLGILANLAYGDYPETVDTEALPEALSEAGVLVPIQVTHGREHGALCAVAAIRRAPHLGGRQGEPYEGVENPHRPAPDRP